MHALLHHLEAVGFEGAPRPLGTDDQGREVLTFLDGDVPHPPDGYPAFVRSDDALVATARLLRHYHEAVGDFRPPAGAPWRFVGDRPLRPGEIVCHNDVAPYNTVYGPSSVRGFIDWDIACPAAPAWDLAHLAWHAVPLRSDKQLRQEWPAVPDRTARLRLLCDAYGLDDRAAFVRLVVERVTSSRDGIHRMADAGEAAFVALRDGGHTAAMDRTLAWLARHGDGLQVALDRGWRHRPARDRRADTGHTRLVSWGRRRDGERRGPP